VNDQIAQTPCVPHFQLRLAIAFLVLPNLRHLFTDSFAEPWSSLIGIPLGLWIAYLGVYRSPQLQWLWGGVALLSGIAGLYLVGVTTKELDWSTLARFACFLGIGYLLILDPKVRAYRRWLLDREVLPPRAESSAGGA
jgi:hypothetical protein